MILLELFFLQPYRTLQDVMKLALKAGAKKIYKNSTTTKSVAKKGYVKGSSSWNPSGTETTPTPQVKNEVQQKPTFKSKICFKCQGLGHIASACHDRKVFDLVDKDGDKEEDVIESNHVSKRWGEEFIFIGI